MGKGKLDNTQRAAIYQAWKDGTSQAELARQYGVSDVAIHQLIKKLSAADGKLKNAEPLKKTQINKEFDAAVDEMIAESNAADAEKKSVNAEPDKLPPVVRRAIDDQISEYEFQICERDSRIEELKEEITEFRKDIDALREWKEQHT
jgi:predicted DNA-binding protein YlxM (UPF0122 family)